MIRRPPRPPLFPTRRSSDLFLALMIGSTTMDFLIAQRITPSRTDSNRKKWLIFSLVLNFGILGVFKYFDFFTGSFSSALETLGIHHIPLPLIRVILPPGISFYTFQEVAYIVDVYKGRRSEEHTSELQSRLHLVCRLLLEKKKNVAYEC